MSYSNNCPFCQRKLVNSSVIFKQDLYCPKDHYARLKCYENNIEEIILFDNYGLSINNLDMNIIVYNNFNSILFDIQNLFGKYSYNIKNSIKIEFNPSLCPENNSYSGIKEKLDLLLTFQ